MAQSNYRPNVDGLRAMAVLLVVPYHLRRLAPAFFLVAALTIAGSARWLEAYDLTAAMTSALASAIGCANVLPAVGGRPRIDVATTNAPASDE